MVKNYISNTFRCFLLYYLVYLFYFVDISFLRMYSNFPLYGNVTKIQLMFKA